MRPVPNAKAPKKRTERFGWRALVFLLTAACLLSTLLAQAGRQAHPSSTASTVLNVVATRVNGASNPITAKDISLFDNGVEQSVRNFAPDMSPARIVLLVDNSLTIRAAERSGAKFLIFCSTPLSNSETSFAVIGAGEPFARVATTFNTADVSEVGWARRPA